MVNDEPIVRIEIAPYDSRWPILYEEERVCLAAALGDMAPRIEHIGSTSVPGLSAKAIIDVQVAMASLEPVETYSERLRSLGYTYFPVLGNTDRYSFGKGVPHTHHVHIVEYGSEEYIRPIAFRDYLRAHAEVARQYEALKRTLAARFRHDRQGYNSAKTDFIRSIEAMAHRQN